MPASTDCEIVSARVLDAPRQVVYRAFTDPSLLARWWGPAGFTNTFHEFDPRPGGAWRFVMRGPDGTDYRNESQFVEVVAPERIVFDHLRPMHRFRMTMTLADEAGRTRLTWRMLFESPEEADRVRAVVTRANEENFDRLQAVLATPRAGIFLPPGEGRPYPMGRISAVFKADGGETRGAYSISEWWLEPHTQGPGAHAHPEDDVFYVIEGTMSFLIGDAWVDAPRGSFVVAPGGMTHDFQNRSAQRAGVLNFSIPGDFEQHMPAIAAWFAEHPPGNA